MTTRERWLISILGLLVVAIVVVIGYQTWENRQRTNDRLAGRQAIANLEPPNQLSRRADCNDSGLPCFVGSIDEEESEEALAAVRTAMGSSGFEVTEITCDPLTEVLETLSGCQFSARYGRQAFAANSHFAIRGETTSFVITFVEVDS